MQCKVVVTSLQVAVFASCHLKLVLHLKCCCFLANVVYGSDLYMCNMLPNKPPTLTKTSLLQDASMCCHQGSFSGQERFRATPDAPIPIKLPESPLPEALLHGQRVAGSRSGCSCIHEEAGGAQVSLLRSLICRATVLPVKSCQCRSSSTTIYAISSLQAQRL